MQLEGVWWLYFPSSWLRQMPTMASQSSAQRKRAERQQQGLVH